MTFDLTMPSQASVNNSDLFEPFRIDVDGIPLMGRPMTDTDVPYIYHSWVAECGHFKEHPKAHTRAAIDVLLADSGTVRLVLCAPEDPSFIVGFLVGSVDVLHMAFVKGSFRGHGVARWMLGQLGIEQGRPFGHTFKTRDLERASRRGWEPIHIPTFSMDRSIGRRS